ncbi:MAG: metal-responsive CopG/Arc/MetJ family transcriptional regulator [Haloarculaceae archaeon]|jgi:metal-responsive CopG/Arc/MetJ family transcriptional regulator
MPPDGYTTVTISEETAEELDVLVARHDLESRADGIGHAVGVANAADEDISDAELAKLLYERLA